MTKDFEKRNLEQKVNDSKRDIRSLPCNVRFSSRKYQGQQKLEKKLSQIH